MAYHETHPLVSVIVPGYNHAPYLTERIRSILAQDYANIELILLDDCSTDGSADILQEYNGHPKVKGIVVNAVNSGSTFAQWKKGLSMAVGEYVWIAESDDSASPEFLSTMVDALESHPEAAMAFAGSVMIDADGKEIEGMDWDRWPEETDGTALEMASHELIASHLLFTNRIYNASQVLMKRSVIPVITDRQTHMRYCGDWMFWVDLLAGAKSAVMVCRKLNCFRQHSLKVSPVASKAGLYFTEGLPVMIRVAEILDLDIRQRRVLAGRFLKRLRKFPEVKKNHCKELTEGLESLSPGTRPYSLRPLFSYWLDKNLTKASGLSFK